MASLAPKKEKSKINNVFFVCGVYPMASLFLSPLSLSLSLSLSLGSPLCDRHVHAATVRLRLCCGKNLHRTHAPFLMEHLSYAAAGCLTVTLPLTPTTMSKTNVVRLLLSSRRGTIYAPEKTISGVIMTKLADGVEEVTESMQAL